MSNYAKVFHRFWLDEKIRSLHPDEKLALLYLFSSPVTNQIGLYCVDPYTIGKHTGLGEKKAAAAIDQLKRMGVIDFDAKTDTVWVINKLKLDPPASSRNAKNFFNAILGVPMSEMVKRAMKYWATNHNNEAGAVSYAAYCNEKLSHMPLISISENQYEQLIGHAEAPNQTNPNQTNPNQTNNGQESFSLKQSLTEYSDEFDAFWKIASECYSKAGSSIGSKKNAYERWKKIPSDVRSTLAEIITKQANGKVEANKSSDGKSFAPHFRHLEGYLSGEMWHEPVWQRPTTTKITDYQPLTEEQMAWKPRTKQPQ